MVTTQELRELMQTQEAVLYYDERVHEDIEFKCVSAIILRYNPQTERNDVTAELTDRTGRCVVVASPKRITRKIKEAV